MISRDPHPDYRPLFLQAETIEKMLPVVAEDWKPKLQKRERGFPEYLCTFIRKDGAATINQTDLAWLREWSFISTSVNMIRRLATTRTEWSKK